ncbi:plasminogen receptor (KT) [Erpetoichthys calabaricus]|uniref:Plasminogen receptor, C-terminal lysine transmembrane protein n=1 Tax=Erpetoichthys calabaricus TaxID=27687 RepID=A0A8C4T9Z7_ERPCA|nr:plasminogen receptor (KT) [Erpetoichthys calabaricus]
MGFLMSKSLDENMKKQQEFMLLNSRLQLERQILMQNQMRERQMAMQIAWSREFLKYYGTFFGLVTVGCTLGALKKNRPAMLVPLVPLSLILLYQADMAYGTLLTRMKAEAEQVLDTESYRLQLPHGTPNFESIEKARRAQSTFFIEK